jgi:hypothetical protein
VSTAAVRERVVLALAGRRTPVVGEQGLLESPCKGAMTKIEIVVERVSPSGKTIWLRVAPGAHGGSFAGRWVRGRWGTDWFPYSADDPIGVVTFPRDR